MLLIFCRTFTGFSGGVQIFNRELENLLAENRILFRTASAPVWTESFPILNYIARLYNALAYCFVKRNQSISILVQYSGFLDVCVLPFLALTSKKIYMIAHVGEQLKHLRSPFLRKLTQLFLRCFVYRLLLLSDNQTDLFRHPASRKIHTIINKAYANNVERKPMRQGNYLLYLGRICVEKGISDLVTAYSFVKTRQKEFPPMRIIGPGEDRYLNQLEKEIKRLGLSSYVILEEPVYDIANKIRLLSEAILVVYPSHADAFPLTVIESIACGTPCLATDISETGNFIACTDYLFTPKNINELSEKLEKLYKEGFYHEQVMETLIKKARLYAHGRIIDDLRDIGII